MMRNKMTDKKEKTTVQISILRTTRAALKLLAAKHQLTMQQYIDKLIAKQKQ